MRADLVVKAQEGDEQAFASLLLPLYERLHQIAYRMLRDRSLAEEAVQHAALAMWRNLPSLRDPARFEAWSYRLVVNAAHSEGRKRRRRQHEVPSELEQDPVVRDVYGVVHDRDRLERAFAALSMDQRAVVVLHHYLDMKVDDVAEALGIPAGTARSRLHRALKTMREALDEERPGNLVPSPQDVRR